MKTNRLLKLGLSVAILLPSLLMPVYADSIWGDYDPLSFTEKYLKELGLVTADNEDVTTVSIDTEASEPYTRESIAYLNDELEDSQNINGDVQAMLSFDSGLIHVAVVQSKNPNKYLYKDWKTGRRANYGSITLDPDNNLNKHQMNTVIYGHLIYDWKIKQYGFQDGDRRLVFSPLKYLMNSANYESNKYVTLVTNNEARYYEVARVYNCPIWRNREGIVTADYMEYNLPYYDENYFNKYMAKVDRNSYYNTGVNLEYGDNLLTLQTCIQNRPNNREIVICKELMRMPLDEAKKSFWIEKQKFWNQED